MKEEEEKKCACYGLFSLIWSNMASWSSLIFNPLLLCFPLIPLHFFFAFLKERQKISLIPKFFTPNLWIVLLMCCTQTQNTHILIGFKFIFFYFFQTIGSLPKKFWDAYLVISRLKRKKKKFLSFSFFFFFFPLLFHGPSARYIKTKKRNN